MRKRFQEATDTLWFTADLHFGHDAMIQPTKGGRPFANVEEMDATIIDNWNRVIKKRDSVFIIGDFAFRSRKDITKIVRSLNGVLYLIEGNHDRMIAGSTGLFEGGIEKYHEIWVDKLKIVMCHFAFRSWNLMHYGSWNLHGHSHGNLPLSQGKQLDVGIDNVGAVFQARAKYPCDYRPLRFDEIKAYMDAKPIHSDDHHQPKEEQPTHEDQEPG